MMDMDLNGIALDILVPAVDQAGQGITGKHPARVAHKLLQQRQLAPRQAHILALIADVKGVRVQADTTTAQYAADLALAAAQQGA